MLLQFNNEKIDALWESDVRRWLIECKTVSNPSKEDVDKWGNHLNSDSVSREDLISFEKLTGWKRK